MTLPGAQPFDEDLTKKLSRALAGKGASYRPRTEHLRPDGTPLFINRLIFETSPYLLQHAHNPVNWRPWGDEAFQAARDLDRPVLLSVGYSTCHWCHVMEEESFEDLEIAGYINADYVAIKVDREERPDVDSIYMTAVNLYTGRGGWPMTVMLTPDRKPFFAGTYFPPRDGARGPSLGFLTILKRLSVVYHERRQDVVKTAAELSARIREVAAAGPSEGMPGPDALIDAAVGLSRQYDARDGGFGPAPKFPRPPTFELLLRFWRRTRDPGALRMVTHSLRKMSDGGIYDHVGGGFHRYSTDSQWLVPHFEKML